MAPSRRLDHTLETTMVGSYYKAIMEEATRILEEDWKTDDDIETDLLGETTYGDFRLDRGVRFSMTIRQHASMSIEEYTEDEVRNCWYSFEDKEKMYEKHNKMVARFESGKKAKKGSTYRGLECWTTKGGCDLDLNISKCTDAVMDEQDAQWSASIDDWERVATASREVTVGSAKRALATGQEYEREAIEARSLLEYIVSGSGEHEVVKRTHSRKSIKRTHSRKSKPKSTTKTRRSLRTEDRKDPPGKIRRFSVHSLEDTVHGDDESVSCELEVVKRTNKRQSKPKSKKSKTRHIIRTKDRKDPPGGIRRENSQTASDVLMKMRMAIRKARTLKV
jgi:hypothetical protein